METTKLTLSLKKDIIDQAKQVARSNGLSLSRYIQNFLEKAIRNESLTEEVQGNIPQEIRNLRGILKGSGLTKESARDLKYEYLKEKYGL